MVHALRRARQHLARGGALVCLQPHRVKRPSIAVVAQGRRQPVASLINPVFQPLIDSAEAAIDTVASEGLFVPIGKKNHKFRVRLANPNQLNDYLHTGQWPPRFPAGDRRRLEIFWKSRTAGAQIEVTEFMTIIALRAAT
jgi:hypothetical protein